MKGRRILIIGWPKSGTTALLYKVMGGLVSPRWLFEPKGPLTETLPSDRPVVAKLLFGGPVGLSDYASYEKEFDQRIWIARDVRDVMISRFLWHVSSGQLDEPVSAKARTWLLAKQRDPASRPLAEIFEDPDFAPVTVSGRSIARRAASTTRLLEQHELYRFRYEDMIDGRWEGLEEYLGFPVEHGRELGRRHKLVARSKSYGGWRRWFTPSDVAFYRPFVDPVLRQFDYAVEWDLDEAPDLAAEDPHGYVLARLQEQRQRAGTSGD